MKFNKKDFTVKLPIFIVLLVLISAVISLFVLPKLQFSIGPSWEEPILFPEKVEVLVEYERSGGFMGVSDYMVVKNDGTVDLSTKFEKTNFTIPLQTVKELGNVLVKSNFSKLPSKTSRKQQVVDGFIYKITYKNHTVETYDMNIPSSLEPVISILDQIMYQKGAE